MLRTLVMILVGMLIGCDQEIPFTELPQELVLEKYGQNGELITKQKLSAEDVVYKHLKSLLETEKSGWQSSLVSYKTGPYIFRGESLIIRCYTDRMVVDVMKQQKSTSFKKELPDLLQKLGLGK